MGTRFMDRAKLRTRVVQLLVIALLAAATPMAFASPSNFLAIDGSIKKTGVSTYDWANSGALTTSTAIGGTWTRAGTGGIFDGGKFQGNTTPPTAPTLTPAAAADPTIDAAKFVVDPLSTDTTACGAGDPTTFTTPGADKNDLPIGGFQWGTGTVPNKDELTNAYAISHVTGTSSEIFFGAERVVNNGDSHMDFEFLQSKLGTNVTAAGCAPAGGGTFTGHRTQGDLLISMDFTNGGTFGGLTISRWQCDTVFNAAHNGQICDPNVVTTAKYVSFSTSAAVAEVNSSGPTDCGGWVCRNASGAPVTSVGTNEFLEGGINLADAGFTGCFASFLPHTRTSQEITAVLADFAGPFSFSNCKQPAIATTLSGEGHTGSTISVSAGSSVSDTAVLSGTSGTPKGTVTYQVFSNNTCTTPSTTPTVSQTVTLNADGSVPSTSAVSFPTPGTYYWQASYSGDDSLGGKNLPAVSPCTSEVLTVLPAHIVIAKTADAASVSAGDPIGFTVTVTNTGAGTATGVSMTDTLPVGATGSGISWSITTPVPGCSITSNVLTCTQASLASGASFSVHVASPTTASSCGTYNNTAAVSTTNDGSGTATASTTVNCANIGITKTADASPVNDGSPVGFVVTVNNSGAGTANGVTVTDPLPAAPGVFWVIDAANSTAGCTITGSAGSQVLNCSFGSLASGASAHVHITSPTTGATGATTLVNVASVTTTNDGSGVATATVTVLAAHIAIAKTADASPVNDGDQIGFVVTATNTGAGTATGVTVNDPLPSAGGVNWSIDAANSSAGCTITGAVGSQVLTCTVASLASGASIHVHITSATSSATGSATLVNVASVTTTNDGSGVATATVTVLAPHITILKTADAGVVSSGETIGFTITVGNDGLGVAHGVSLVDVLPQTAGTNFVVNGGTAANTCSGTTTITCAIGDLGPGTTATVHVSSPTTAASCGTISNTGSVTTTNDGSGTSTATITVNCPVIGITKTADASPVNDGDTIGFVVTVANTGAGTAANVTVHDPLPAAGGVNWSIDAANSSAGCTITGAVGSQVLTCTIASLASGASIHVHITSATSSATGSATLVNVASVTTTNDGSGVATATVTVLAPHITLVKTADADSVSAGTAIGFTLTVGNDGLGLAHGVTINDALPQTPGTHFVVDGGTAGNTCSGTTSITCSIGDLAAGTTATVHVSSPTTALSCGSVDNTGNATSANDGSAQASASVTVLCANVGITKTADASPVSDGTSIGFVVTIANTGAGTATGVTVNDPLPSAGGVNWSIDAANSNAGCTITGAVGSQVLSCTYATLAPGAAMHVHITSPTTGATGATTLVNVATVTTTNDGGGTATATVTVLAAHIAIAKTADASPVNDGDTIGFVVTATNTGAGTATGVTVTDPLPAAGGVNWSIDAANSSAGCTITGAVGSQVLTCTIASLEAGASIHVHITSATSGATGSATLVNVASVTTTNDGSGVATATVTVLAAHITIAKTADAATVSAGDSIGFTIGVTNTGAGSATNVVMTDTLPTGTGLSWSINPPVAGCAITGNVLTCTREALAAGAGFTVHITSATTAASCGIINNTAAVTTGNDGSGTASAATTVLCPDVTVVKTAAASTVTPTVTASATAGFSITTSNAGLGTAKGVTMTDVLATGVTWTIASQPAGNPCSITSGVLNCAFGDMAPGTSATVSIVTTVQPVNCGTLINTATVGASNEPASALGNDSSTAQIAVNCVAAVLAIATPAAPVVVQPVRVLPVTGWDPRPMGIAGLALLAAGGVLLMLSNGREAERAAPLPRNRKRSI